MLRRLHALQNPQDCSAPVSADYRRPAWSIASGDAGKEGRIVERAPAGKPGDPGSWHLLKWCVCCSFVLRASILHCPYRDMNAHLTPITHHESRRRQGPSRAWQQCLDARSYSCATLCCRCPYGYVKPAVPFQRQEQRVWWIVDVLHVAFICLHAPRHKEPLQGIDLPTPKSAQRGAALQGVHSPRCVRGVSPHFFLSLLHFVRVLLTI